jgi:hypothetical protein
VIAMISTGSRVKYMRGDKLRTGTVKDIPNNFIAWINEDGTTVMEEHGIELTKMEEIMTEQEETLCTHCNTPLVNSEKTICQICFYHSEQRSVHALDLPEIQPSHKGCENMINPATDPTKTGSIKKDGNKDNRLIGAGGAPTRATTLPEDPADRKNYPIASGVLDYFPDAFVAISKVSKAGNDQHNPGLPLRWTRSKSGDEADTCIRHFLQRGTLDTDGLRHTAKAAWRILALLQKEIENDDRK